MEFIDVLIESVECLKYLDRNQSIVKDDYLPIQKKNLNKEVI